jgi:L-2-hydroxyglutarate oxidase LhgO
MKADGTYDIVIIGGGVVGCAIARELSRWQVSVLVLEADDDVGQGATKGNSGIVHAGYDDKPGSVRAKFCWPGNQMFPKLDEELHFGYFKNGSLVVARSEEDEETLQRLLDQGEQNGVQNLKIVRGEELRELEPELTDDARAALHAPDAGIVIPYEFAIALAENAADNGVEFRIRRRVTAIEREGGTGGFTIKVDHADIVPPPPLHPPTHLGFVLLGLAVLPFVAPIDPWICFLLALAVLFFGFVYHHKKKTAHHHQHFKKHQEPVSMEETVRAKFIVNAAGGASDKIAQMVGDNSFKVKPRYGEYLLADKNEGQHVRRTLFPAPGPKGKGVLAQRTLWGNACYGPTARDYDEAIPTKEETISHILGKCRELVPSIDSSKIFHSFTGARAKTSRGDWIIEEASRVPGFIHAAGIDSPGLAGSPAIALEVVDLLRKAGCSELKVPNPLFDPQRPPIVAPKNGWKNLKLQKNLDRAFECKNPKENVVCKCEKVTEAEIVEAIRRSLPVDNTQAIRRRTRAGMGDCQGRPDNYDCEARVKVILERELGRGAHVGTRPWPASSILPRRCLTEEDKNKLGKM